MRLKGRQLDAINAAIKSGGDVHAALQETCEQVLNIGQPKPPKHINYDLPTPETDAFMLRIDDSEIDLGQVKAQLSDMERTRDTALETLRGREQQWMFGVSVLDFCIQKAAQMYPGELPMEAIRRWMQERWESREALKEISKMAEKFESLNIEKDEDWQTFLLWFENLSVTLSRFSECSRDSERAAGVARKPSAAHTEESVPALRPPKGGVQ